MLDAMPTPTALLALYALIRPRLLSAIPTEVMRRGRGELVDLGIGQQDEHGIFTLTGRGVELTRCLDHISWSPPTKRAIVERQHHAAVEAAASPARS